MQFFVDHTEIAKAVNHPQCRLVKNEITALWVKLHQAGMKNSIVTLDLFHYIFGRPGRLVTRQLLKLLQKKQQERDQSTDWFPFVDLVASISFMSPNASVEEKLRGCFDVFCNSGRGAIYPNDLFFCVKEALSDCGLIVPDHHIWTSVGETFNAVDTKKDGMIDINEFMAEYMSRPNLFVSLIGDLWQVLSETWVADYSLFRAVRGDGGSQHIFRNILSCNNDNAEADPLPEATGKSKPFFKFLLDAPSPVSGGGVPSPDLKFAQPEKTGQLFRMMLE